ncbi:MAG: hypothetical protein IPK17_20505 [Chloroflexi bacterium]|uniref:hypothetical protein n=1 Tax=Candidatus Flexifilum breve TaxID=3140694 RepID=UPI0031357AEF|nr:hypothetical protein [Chloroflexota bacterium]
MAHHIHEQHQHTHSEHCGHIRIIHNGHVDYLHDGHLHHMHEDHYDEHVIEISDANPNICSAISCGCDHIDSGHPLVPHGDHYDYLVNGHLHHKHGDHCDDHGTVQLA